MLSLTDLPHRARLLLLALWAVGLGGLAVFAVHVVFDVGGANAPGFQGLYVVLALIAAALCLLRAALFSAERAAWSALGAAAVLIGAGYAHYFLALQGLDVQPYPSISDAVWLSSYALSFVGVILLVRARVTGFTRALWVDAAVGVLTVAAIGAALVIDPVLSSTGGEVSAVATALGYPGADVLLVGVVLIVFTLSGWRPGPVWYLLAAAYGVQLMADVVYLRQVATDGYETGTILDLAYPLALYLVAGAAWMRPSRGRTTALSGWPVLAVPALFTVIALGLTTYSSFQPINKIAVVLATLTLVLAFVRTAITFADLRTVSQGAELLQRQTLILDSAGEGIYGMDLEGRTTFANAAAARLTGHDQHELVGIRQHELIHHSHADGTPYPPEECPAHMALSEGDIQHVTEDVYWRKDGTSFPVEYTSTPLVEDGSVTGAVVVFKDITERREVERLKDEFTSVVSHELRTPLTSIRGSLGLLAGGALGELPPQGQRMVEIAVSNTDRLVRLINDILDIERIEAGTVSMDRRGCEADDLVAQVAGVMEPMAQEAGITLSTAAAPVALWADPDRIIQTLTNLVSNAIKFSPAGSEISVTCVREGDEALFRVADQGRGVPAENLESIFERFQQVDASDSREKAGTGLGLAICRSIVSQHGGEIWVESQPGRGATFSFRLPALTGPTIAPDDVLEDGPVVLVCDDDDGVREVVCALLAQRGYRPLPASCGEEAIRLARAGQPDVVLLDLLMPGLSGWDTAEALRADPETSSIPIVILSVVPADAAEPIGDGVDGWVAKPLDEASLFEELDRAVYGGDRHSRVLVVEDDADLAGILCTMFERHGLQAFHAATGDRAIELSQEVDPDLLVLDLALPGTDGFAVVDWLRHDDRLRRVPLVVYTARDLDAGDRDRLRLAAGTQFLTKGRITPAQFEQRVMKLLGRMTQHGEEVALDVAQARSGR